MKMFVTLVAALPMAAAALPMFVSIGAALASRYRLVRVRRPHLIGKGYAGKYRLALIAHESV